MSSNERVGGLLYAEITQAGQHLISAIRFLSPDFFLPALAVVLGALLGVLRVILRVLGLLGVLGVVLGGFLGVLRVLSGLYN